MSGNKTNYSESLAAHLKVRRLLKSMMRQMESTGTESKSGGALGCKFKETTLKRLEQEIKKSPYNRVGATSDESPKRRIWNYPSGYDHSTVTFAKTNDSKSAENQLLNLLPANMPYNVHRKSNMPVDTPGYVYVMERKEDRGPRVQRVGRSQYRRRRR